ncbi:MAG TPA: hypothetical protein VFJ97_16505 [Dermatophilaceae bacterium]|nr:hypothetical protein [Dermatophilaceae bacterium]
MYAALWRALPGPWPVKLVQSLVLALGAVAACFLWVFPAVAPYMPFNSTTVDDQARPTPSVSVSTPVTPTTAR